MTAVKNEVPDASEITSSDYASEITSIKNDYATNASLDSKLNDLQSQHIADEVKKVDDKVKKNTYDILGYESRLKQKEDIVDVVQRENSFNRGFNYYLEESYLVYNLKVIPNAQGLLPTIENNGRMNVEFNGNYFV